MKDRARQQAANRDWQSAKDTWLEAVQHLQAALRISGGDPAGLIQKYIRSLVCRSLTTRQRGW
jgi:hypothetical protein